VPERPVQGTPHARVAREDRIHQEDMADKLVIGVVIGEVVEDDEAVIESDAENEKGLRKTQDHGVPEVTKILK
jgi:hypothetical protein